MFAICGVRGDLCTTPNGPAVAYEDTGIANDKYYYRPSGKLSFCVRLLFSVSTSPGHCAFVDYKGLNDRITTTEGTGRHPNFRNDVVRRDGPACIVTEAEDGICDAAHLIPLSKVMR